MLLNWHLKTNDGPFVKTKILSYVGFRKNHPHDSYSIIRLAFREAPPDAIQDIIKMFQDVCLEANKTYSEIASEFN